MTEIYTDYSPYIFSLILGSNCFFLFFIGSRLHRSYQQQMELLEVKLDYLKDLLDMNKTSINVMVSRVEFIKLKIEEVKALLSKIKTQKNNNVSDDKVDQR